MNTSLDRELAGKYLSFVRSFYDEFLGKIFAYEEG